MFAINLIDVVYYKYFRLQYNLFLWAKLWSKMMNDTHTTFFILNIIWSPLWSQKVLHVNILVLNILLRSVVTKFFVISFCIIMMIKLCQKKKTNYHFKGKIKFSTKILWWLFIKLWGSLNLPICSLAMGVFHEFVWWKCILKRRDLRM